MSYCALAYFKFVEIDDPKHEVEKHKIFFEERDITCRIYISEEGINGQLSGSKLDASAYMKWLRKDPRFADISFKVHIHPENIFPRQTVKYRKQLVAVDCQVDMNKGGTRLSPSEWRALLESDEDVFLLDVRNQYEWEIGHFEGAELPPLTQFRDFPSYAEELKGRIDPAKTKILMYCTGGIRCEVYSALMKEKGFQEIYQLHGGILNYGLKEGSAHWRGKCFVFDDRLAIPIDGEEAPPIAKCFHCHLPSDTYYNCANMDCNKLFLSCKHCSAEYQGCCCYECTQSPRLRSFQARLGNKPFRRKHLIPPSESEGDESM